MRISNIVAALPFAKHISNQKLTDQAIEFLAEYAVKRALHPTVAKYKAGIVTFDVIRALEGTNGTFADFEIAFGDVLADNCCSRYPSNYVDIEFAVLPDAEAGVGAGAGAGPRTIVFLGKVMYVDRGTTRAQQISSCLSQLNHEHQSRMRASEIAKKVEEYRMTLESETPILRDNLEITIGKCDGKISIETVSAYEKLRKSECDSFHQNTWFRKIEKKVLEEPTPMEPKALAMHVVPAAHVAQATPAVHVVPVAPAHPSLDFTFDPIIESAVGYNDELIVEDVMLLN